MVKQLVFAAAMIIVSGTSFLASSSEQKSKGTQLDIAGSWVFQDSFSVCNITFSDSIWQWERPSLQMSGSGKITYYNNSANELVVHNLVHPDPGQQNAYMRISWTPDIPDSIGQITLYQYHLTQDSALAETQIIPDEPPQTIRRVNSKVQTRIFDLTHRETNHNTLLSIGFGKNMISSNTAVLIDLNGKIAFNRSNLQSCNKVILIRKVR